ncbi:hypothetical protein PENARI_c016G08309 [Penicillium arizonense]|uniref:Uncharacterized protein n=1 Tax=Penicillium arizonense TaxID=1835702 RepID=A0A1F5LBV6_PENAI|nr:hypothetical protein PENARI_c016G08309 [Penicillium arizonense]
MALVVHVWVGSKARL